MNWDFFEAVDADTIAYAVADKALAEVAQLQSHLSRFQQATREILSQYPQGLPLLLEPLKLVLEESEVGSEW